MSIVKSRLLIAVGLVGGLLAPSPAWAGRCNQVTTVTDASGGAETISDISDRAALICSVEFIANGSNGWAAVYDTPDDSFSNTQATVKSEPGSATALNSVQRYYGPDGIPTRFGIDVEVVNGTLVIQWSGTAP